MRQQPKVGFDDATTMAAFGSRAVQLVALPEADPGLPEATLPPAVAELLHLIRQGLVPVPSSQEALANSFPGALPVVIFGASVPDHMPAAEPGFEIVPLQGPGMPALSLDDHDLFGSAEISPFGAEELSAPMLFRGFQLDLFGFGDEAPGPPALEVTIDPLPGPLAPPSVEIGKVTMFEGMSEFELFPDVAVALVDENGRLVIEGDGDDLVILGDTWSPISGQPDGEGYVYYVESGSGLAVGIRGADVLLV